TSVAALPAASGPIVQSPVPGSYVPCDGLALTNTSPAGSLSWRTTPVASSGPRLLTVIVYATVSPTFGVWSSITLVTPRSACVGVSVAMAGLLDTRGSNWLEPVPRAEFCSVFGEVTRARRVSTACAPVASDPTFQTPVELA